MIAAITLFTNLTCHSPKALFKKSMPELRTSGDDISQSLIAYMQ
jgi:IclR family pca regulon transcriptional regulator